MTRDGYSSWIMAVSAATGVAGTEWRSDLVLANPARQPAVVQVELIGLGTRPGLEVNLAGGETKRIVDVLGDGGFGLSGNAALHLRTDLPVFAHARIYNQASEGSFGQLLTAAPASYGLRGDEIGLLPMLAGPEGFRSNVGFVNPTLAEQRLQLEILNDDGQLIASHAVDLEAGQRVQLGQVVSTASAWGRVQLVAGDGPVLVYGSVIDVATGDPTTINMVR